MVTSTMLAILGQMACYTGKKVAWDEAIRSKYTLGPGQCSFHTNPPVKPGAKGIYPVPIPGVTRLA